MAEKSNGERIKEAMRTLAAARTEISAEAHWLREQLDPRLAAHRMVGNHTKGILVATFATGLGLAWLIFRHRSPARERFREPLLRKGKEEARKKGIIATLATAAVPLLIKVATSKPVVTRVLGKLQERALAHLSKAHHVVS
jgi:hypothetical protein